MNDFEVIKNSNQIQISFVAKKDKKEQKIVRIFSWLLPLSFLIATIYNCYVRYFNGIFAFALCTLAFTVLLVLSIKSDRQVNAFHLTIDSIGFHESSISFERKDILWEEVCYIDYLPDLYLKGGKYAQKFPVLVISKSPMTEEERFKFLKHQSLGSGIDKSSSPNDIIIASDLMQISRIYQLIAEQAVLHGCEHALQKEVEDD